VCVCCCCSSSYIVTHHPPPPATRLSFRVKMIDTSLEAPKTTGDLSRPPLQVVVWGPTPVKSTPKLLERQHKSFDSLLLFIFSRVYIKECQLGIFPFFLDTFPILSQQTSPPPPPSMSLDMPNCNFRFLAKINKISKKSPQFPNRK
jgi:hypothetical protein